MFIWGILPGVNHKTPFAVIVAKLSFQGMEISSKRTELIRKEIVLIVNIK